MDTTEPRSAIQIALQIVGSQPVLAGHCGVTQSLVSQWMNGRAAIHHRHWQNISNATNGQVSVEMLAADELAKTREQIATARKTQRASSRTQVA